MRLKHRKGAWLLLAVAVGCKAPKKEPALEASPRVVKIDSVDVSVQLPEESKGELIGKGLHFSDPKHRHDVLAQLELFPAALGHDFYVDTITGALGAAGARVQVSRREVKGERLSLTVETDDGRNVVAATVQPAAAPNAATKQTIFCRASTQRPESIVPLAERRALLQQICDSVSPTR